MKGKIFFFVFISLFITASVLALNTVPFSLKGVFFMTNGWSGIAGVSPIGGYPGRVDYGTGNAEIHPDGTLSGNIWMGNVGWVTFSHGVGGAITRINCPTDIWNNSTQPCYLTGSAWSENAGWIVFGSGDIGTGSGAYFDPNTGNLAGYGWNQGIGWVPLWSGLSGSVIPNSGSTTSPLDGVPINFVSRIAIVGNIAGSRVFSVQNNSIVNQDVGYSYNTVNHSNILNMLRRNIALMSRNISDAELLDVFSSHDFIIIKGTDYRIEFGSWDVSNGIQGKRTIIVVGGDIILDQNYVNAGNGDWSNKNVTLIALKNETGSGGNIVISEKVRRIYAYMYAEGTVYSGEKADSSSPIIPYSDAGVWNIPKGQLYIRGLVASKNTIGGSQKKPTPICPVLVSGCNVVSSYAYDWDYFRTYDSGSTAQRALPAERTSVAKLQNATMIIEYDNQILVDPPPGFREQ